MAKAAKKKATKPRASEYEKKVAFDGTFEDMIAISVKDALKKMNTKKVEKSDTGEGVYRVQVIVGNGFGRVSKVVDNRLQVRVISFQHRSKYNDIIFKLWAISVDDAREKVKNLCTDNWEIDFDKIE